MSRFENEEYSSCFALKSTVYIYIYSAIGLSRFENEEYSLCFALLGIPLFRTKSTHCPWRVSLPIHGSYEKSIYIILYIALFGSHARFENEDYSLCFVL